MNVWGGGGVDFFAHPNTFGLEWLLHARFK